MSIRINRVYTRGGDAGETALVGGKRVPKDSPRIVSYGTIDELNSILGLVRSYAEREAPHPAVDRLLAILKKLQNDLFDLGSELATPPDGEYEGMWKTSPADVEGVESWIDECQEDLEPLSSFVLPGGGMLGAYLHQARTVCRRAEINVLELSRLEEINPLSLRYVNRLSDLFFVLSRWISKQLGAAEFLWERGLQDPRKKGGTTSE